jgi:site-specific recombinase XerD
VRVHVDGFAELLIEQGYAKQTIAKKLTPLCELSRWLERRSLKVQSLDESRIEEFLSYRKKKQRLGKEDTATTGQFLGFLRNAGLIPSSVSKTEDSPIQRIETRFAQYLLQERGLSQRTIANYLPFCHGFLTERCGDGKLLLRSLRPKEVSDFVLHTVRATRHNRATHNHDLVTGLRSLLRFLYQQGKIATDLASAVPTVSRQQFTQLPKFLQPEEVERLVHSCDQSTPIGKRDYAILMLLARLGLRAGEIVHLTLDDIHWEAGEIVVRGKSSQEERLPMAHDVGKALAVYLRRSRPRCSSRRVFIRLRAPLQGFHSSEAVCNVVRRALSRAGLNPTLKGTGLLRHSLATNMLRGGASLAEIGEILRHQQPNTTEIYAKVDLAALRSVAQPWPGEAS